MRFWQAAAVMGFLSTPALADNCTLISYGTIALTQIPGDSREYIPVEIAGVPRLLLLDTGSERTVITKAAVKELHLEEGWNETAFYDLNGGKASHLTRTTLKLGILKGDHITFWMYSADEPFHFTDPRVAGVLGYDILMKFDVSIDFGAHTLTLLSPNHCAGQVVYWPERPVVANGFRFKKVTPQIHMFDPPLDQVLFTFPTELDGLPIRAMPNSGVEMSAIEHRRAKTKYELELGSTDTPIVAKPSSVHLLGYEVGTVDPTTVPGLTKKPEEKLADGKVQLSAAPAEAPAKENRHATYSHNFKTLTFGGITVNDPEIYIIPDVEIHHDLEWTTGNMLDAFAHAAEKHESLIRLGMNVLKHLRVYVAYQERMIYISPSSTENVRPAP